MRYPILIALFAAFTSPAWAEDPGWYVSGQVGATLLDDADNSGGGITLESDFDTGFNIAGAVGHAFGNGFRVEGEIAYRENGINDLTITNDGGLGVAAGVGSLNGLSVNADGDTSALSFMANAFYDFEVEANVTPYIGAGVGLANVSANDITANGVLLVDDDDTVFAYQAIAGLAFDVANNTELFADYRFFATDDPSLTDAGGAGFDTEYQSHNLSGGVRLNF